MPTREEIITIADEIERYLARHPNAGDTANAIAQWWLPRQRIEEHVAAVIEALEYLEKNGRIVRRSSVSGETYHRVDDETHDNKE